MKFYFFIFLVLAFSLFAQNSETYYFQHYKIDLPINNKGVLADVKVGENNTQMRFNDSVVVYTSGFLLSGTADGTLWVNGMASVARVEDYLPGSYKYPEFDNLAKIYVLKKSDQPFGESWQSWRNAVKLGADFYDGDDDGLYNPIDINENGKWDFDEDRPDLLGNQTAWCVYKDDLPSADRAFNNVIPFGIEIQQTVFASSINESFRNTIFVRYRIENSGLVTNLLDSVYFSIMTDPDLGMFLDDLVGCDTLINAGYVYQTKPDDSFTNTPSLIMHFVQGPTSYIPNVTYLDNNKNGIFDSTDTPINSAYNVKGSFLGMTKVDGATNTSISSFSNFLPVGPTMPEYDERHYRSKMLGYLLAQESLFDPCNDYFSQVFNEDCSNISPYFWYSGDPVVPSGWINTRNEDQRIMINTGPFQLERNKPIDIVIAYTIGESYHPLQSLKIAKINARNVQFYFRNNAFESGNKDSTITICIEPVLEFKLNQNYPNPFGEAIPSGNPTTKISYSIPFSDVPKNITLQVYNLLGEVVATLINKVQTVGNYSVEFSANNLSSGVYIYRISNGELMQSKKLMVLK